MRKLLFIVSFVLLSLLGQAEQNIVTESYTTGGQYDISQPLKVIRTINGGTVFRVEYGTDVQLHMQGAFEYACKLLEEYLPSCLPITVKVEIEDFDSEDQISRINSVAYEMQFGSDHLSGPKHTHFKPKMKYILFHDYAYYGGCQYIDSIPNMDFFTNMETPDITITYNRDILSSCSFSITEEPEADQYDFVTIALRDLLKGLGFCNSTKIHPNNPGQLVFPARSLTDFEEKSIGNLKNAPSTVAYNALTQGAIPLYVDYNEPHINLYAPQSWMDGVSLNQFIPDSVYSISNVLSYEFGKGTYIRDINDKYGKEIFKKLLGWDIVIYVGTGSSSFSESGNNQNKIPYKKPQKSINQQQPESVKSNLTLSLRDSIDEYIKQYIPRGSDFVRTFEILKKDGTWDEVGTAPLYRDFDMSNFTFHYEDDEYARTCDGYLRGREAIVDNSMGPSRYFAHYYVVDYLPSKVKMRYDPSAFRPPLQKAGVGPLVSAHLFYIKDYEGLTDFKVEVKRTTDKLPVLKEVNNWKNGCFSLTIPTGGVYLVTGVSYNANGVTRSYSYYLDTRLQSGGGIIIGNDFQELYNGMEYEIIPLNSTTVTPIQKGIKEGDIDTSNLPNGMYVLNIKSENGIEYSQKIVKQ